ncbi:glycosyltransferase involved in cell wall biosynthesis [Kitasatospora gansuensis]|uniref:Glycosyltransferase involved in cell wall biosynthesis n=1 Tax=Kitasatospora gansuensis TaxID=258050 RepID=A0A7W7WHD0_9ACTN|nr:glycosyltransferase family 4 protein [Kitasatospora gansuensis]MBB4947023.1 glycosyltransferase involved in cell wall biosynthesis [Kitasatospora gansuensis]
MRVLQIVNLGFEAGGAEKSVRLIAEGLTARGHQVRVVATDLLAEGQQVFADELVPAVSGGPARRLLGYFWHRPAYRAVRRQLLEFRPDCVHLHTIGEFSPAVLAATSGVPRLLTVHGPEDWTKALLRWNLASASAGGRLSAADSCRYLYLRLLQRPAYLLRLRRVRRVLAPSRYFAEAVRPDVGRVPVHVLPNGIPRTAGAEPVTDAQQLLFVGRLEPVKGVHVLLAAFRELIARHPEARLAVVGDGPERARLEAAAADLVADGRVVFHGWLTGDQVAERLRAASVVVLPSLWPENFPTVALEALQIGRPMVASRVGGLPELVGPDNGALVEAGDVAALAGALGGLIGDLERLALLGKGSAARADRYGVEEFLDNLEHHYTEIVRP